MLTQRAASKCREMNCWADKKYAQLLTADVETTQRLTNKQANKMWPSYRKQCSALRKGPWQHTEFKANQATARLHLKTIMKQSKGKLKPGKACCQEICEELSEARDGKNQEHRGLCDCIAEPRSCDSNWTRGPHGGSPRPPQTNPTIVG